jgi:hypothetical protein
VLTVSGHGLMSADHIVRPRKSAHCPCG